MPLTPEDLNAIREVQESSNRILIKHNKDGSISLSEGAILLLNAAITIAVLGTVVTNLWRTFRTPISNVMKPLKLSDIAQNRIIENILYELLGITQANRCCIGLFENGTSSGSLHWRKMRVSHEVVSPGTEKQKKDLQDVMITSVESEILNSDSDTFVAFIKSDKKLPSGCRAYMDASGFSFMISRLFKSNDLFLKEPAFDAILNIHYDQEPENNPLDDEKTLEEMEVIFNRLLRAIAYIKKGKRLPLDFR